MRAALRKLGDIIAAILLTLLALAGLLMGFF
jgi:hypothetical protein